MLLWAIWFCRNQIRVNNAGYPISQVASNAQQALQDFNRATTSSLVSTHVLIRSRWSPAPLNSWKFNFDGATFKDIGKAGLGVVIWDIQGQAIVSLSEQVPLPFSLGVVEALVVARAISFALEIGCSSFILESDSEFVIKTLSGEEISLSSFGHILQSAEAMIEANCISFSHVRRLGNSVSHNLWMKNVPPHLYFVQLTNTS